MLAKAGLSAAEADAMTHAEAAAWADDILQSMGIKQAGDGGVIVSKRQKPPE
ncbi:TetR family transcriptional regulator [Bergeriella denitrificans]|uniref:TetR family transcriptional regulator n=1 Tax=Bergeriella denitrificans TaxID=494 RepID=UPI000E1B6E5F|nr:TetR family transcriptional regulator [Bergeriella denitrificans]